MDGSLTNQLYFLHAQRKAGEGREKYVWADLTGFRERMACNDVTQ